MGIFTKKQSLVIRMLKKTGGNLAEAGKLLGKSAKAVRSAADQVAKKTGKKGYYKKNTMD